MWARAVSAKGDRHDRGAVAIEFAIVAPVLFLVLFGIVQFGLIFFQIMQAESGAREGVRYAALRYTSTEVVARTKNAARGVNLAGAGSVTVTPAEPSAVTVLNNSLATVTVRIHTPVVLPFFGDELDPDSNGLFDYTATATQRIE